MFAGIPVPQNCGINGKHKINKLCALCGSAVNKILILNKNGTRKKALSQYFLEPSFYS
jgi:hypothetical protein